MTPTMFRRFKLSDAFLSNYKGKQPKWGPLGYVTYKSRYARVIEDGKSEEFWQTLQRVVEGTFNIQKRHCAALGLEWNNLKAQKTAQEMFEAMWEFKFLPPGRGLWMMGSDYVETRTGMGLFNCSMVSTEDIDRIGARPFAFIMDGLMLGVGMGFDTKGEEKVVIQEPTKTDSLFVISDSREGWVESVEALLNAYLLGGKLPKFDYSAIRPEGAPLKGFGGICSGSQPLMDLHEDLAALLDERVGEHITSSDIVDIENYISKCVIAGNIRRSAAIALGRHDDKEFMALKHDKEKVMSHRFGSNNSLFAEIGMDYTEPAANTMKQGEPGYIWLENLRTRGRFKDGERLDDLNVAGVNPCSEQQLESFEMCCLVETFPVNHENLDDYLKTLKLAYLYGKTVTLVNTHWPETNAIMLKNRRIGLSQSGIQQARCKFGTRELLEWCDMGYEHIKILDAKFSDWLCVPRSKRVTSVKPSGTVSLLPGVTPGIHYPEAEYYIRRIRFDKNSPLIPKIEKAGYVVEPDKYNKSGVCVNFPVKEGLFERSKYEVSMWEQLEFAAKYQYYWSDNAVSVTITFRPEEAEHIKHALDLYEDRLKVVSFLPLEDHGYEQPPYEAIDLDTYRKMRKPLKRLNLSSVEVVPVGEKYCDGDKCEV